MLSSNKLVKFLAIGDLVECCCDNSYTGWGVVTKNETTNSFVKVLFFDSKYDVPLEVYPFEIMSLIREGKQHLYDP